MVACLTPPASAPVPVPVSRAQMPCTTRLSPNDTDAFLMMPLTRIAACLLPACLLYVIECCLTHTRNLYPPLPTLSLSVCGATLRMCNMQRGCKGNLFKFLACTINVSKINNNGINHAQPRVVEKGGREGVARSVVLACQAY